MVSGNILASAHGVVGYLQPRGRVSSHSSSTTCLLHQFPFEYVTLNDKLAYVGGYNPKRALDVSSLVFINVLLMLLWKSPRICFYRMYQIYVLGISLQTCFSVFVHIIKSGG